MIAGALLMLLVRLLARLGRPFDPAVEFVGKYLWLMAALSEIDDEEGRGWMAAYLVAHVYTRYGPDGEYAEHTNRQIEKAYHYMHWGRWEEESA